MAELYKKYTDKKIRLKAIFFILMSFILLGVVIVDSFRVNLPFHYILFFIFGLLVSVVINHFSKFSWDDVNSRHELFYIAVPWSMITWVNTFFSRRCYKKYILFILRVRS